MNKEEILEIDILYRGWLGNREHCHLEKIDIYEFCKEYSDLQNQSLQKQLEEVKYKQEILAAILGIGAAGISALVGSAKRMS